jgi:hypothetical protein
VTLRGGPDDFKNCPTYTECPILAMLLECLCRCHFDDRCQRSFWQPKIATTIEVSLRATYGMLTLHVALSLCALMLSNVIFRVCTQATSRKKCNHITTACRHCILMDYSTMIDLALDHPRKHIY